MFDVSKYLESGKIEKCCLGLASVEELEELFELSENYPKIEQAKSLFEQSMTSYLSAEKRNPFLKSHKVVSQAVQENENWSKAVLSDNDKMLDQYIGISRFSNIETLERLFKDIQAPKDFENIYAHPLYVDDTHELILVWAKKVVELEEHAHLNESFLLLEGTADCVIDGEVFKMERGDYMLIPPESEHEVIVTSKEPGKAIRTRIKI